MTSPREIIDYLLPFVVTAGSYSVAVQSRVTAHDAKDGATPFHHALSDADITIQSFIEVVLLARYPQVSFFSEEQDSSLNKKYFASDAELEVLLDPVDGTRAYIDNRPNYQIIVTIHDRRSIVGALAYVPRMNRCYVAIAGEGAFVVTTNEAERGARGQRIALTHAQGPILLFHRPDVVTALSPHFEVLDLANEYERGADGHTVLDLLEGKALATIMAPAQAIDGGALAFIAQQAGAIVTDHVGKPVDSYRDTRKRVLPCVVATATEEAHRSIIGLLQSKTLHFS